VAIISLPQLKQSLEVQPCANLLTLLVQSHVPIAHSCGGTGVCASCSVRIEGEDFPAESQHEQRLKKQQKVPPGERIACLVELPKNLSKNWVITTRYW
jgi:ferredoxin